MSFCPLLFIIPIFTLVLFSGGRPWSESKYEISELKVERINYHAPKSHALLYFSDVFLGYETRNYHKKGTKHFDSLCHVLCRLNYGPWLDCLSDAAIALRNNDPGGYIKIMGRMEVLMANKTLTNTEKQSFKDVKKNGKDLLRKSARVEGLLREAAELVDSPGKCSEGHEMVEAIYVRLKYDKVNNTLSDAIYAQAGLSYANHTGNTESADEIWKNYEEFIEKKLIGHGSDGLKMRLEIRNRRAVSFTDRFQYENALAVIGELIGEKQETRNLLKDKYKLNDNELPDAELAACYGTKGQILAFMGGSENFDQASYCFRTAMELNPTPENIERQWVYLGHVACEMGVDDGRQLWTETKENLPELKESEPVNRSCGQFVLALQLKGQCCFSSLGEIKGIVDQIVSDEYEWGYSHEEMSLHPFGLIYQSIGQLAERVWRESGEKERKYVDLALQYYISARKVMKNGGALLELLSHAANLRHKLLSVEAKSNYDRSKLKSSFDIFKGHIMLHFGDAAWKEDEVCLINSGWFGSRDTGMTTPLSNRVKNMLCGIRFNYH